MTIKGKNEKNKRRRGSGHNFQSTFFENASGALESLQIGASIIQEGIIDSVSEAESQIIKINKKYKIKDKLNTSGTLIYENLKDGAEIIGENLATGVKLVTKEITNIDTEKIQDNLAQSATSFIETVKDEVQIISSNIPAIPIPVISSDTDSNVDNSSDSDSSSLTDDALTALETVGDQIVDVASVVGQEISNITGGNKTKKKKKPVLGTTLEQVGEELSDSVSSVGHQVTKVTKTVTKWFSSMF